MKKRKMLSFCLIIGIALIFAPLTAHSTVLFSDFSPNDPPFDPQSGYTIMGSSNSLGWESSTQGPAFSFSGSASYKLTEVEVAAGLMNGTNSMNFYLMSDNNGVPGIVLVSFNTTALPDWGYPCVTTHLTFSGDLILYPNTTYWLIAEAGDPTTWAGFYWNTIGASGLVARSEGGNPWGLMTAEGTLPTFRVDGALASVPLPSALVLFGPGLLGLFGWRRFRKD
jgi:hypothetical protein